MDKLLKDIKSCTICAENLALGPRPVVSFSKQSKILIVGQAPGSKVHKTGIPWDDASGKQLRKWLDVSDDQFYNTDYFGIVPMGFCYPGKGKSGDLPPRGECAPQWHGQILEKLEDVQLVILIGQYAQKHYLTENFKRNLTETVKEYHLFLPQFFPVPHPSPRNRFWLTKNPWFNDSVLASLQESVKRIIYV